MGIGKLCDLAKDGDEYLAGVAAVLRTELAAGCWRSKDEFQATYPGALIDGAKARILLEADYVVDLIVNFDTGMMLIEHAGKASQTLPRHATKGRAA
ncbi:hypothetical protein IB267_31590 [Ensifer sp. ENS09]|uniref:hypothetical protein n=1 Tax=Ensifer sp. ENS09 TaxID=2769263 RepID=UPI00177FE68C|nr:hypothetical protein [Ensifer sp. ENS09]MBD9652912.1 hypothetical protein [Ensifer sp. ENS09]